jgi:hypothetical protein
MVHDEKIKKVCNDFSLLNDEQQDYVLGILQALVFAKNTGVHSDFKKAVPASAAGNQNTN